MRLIVVGGGIIGLFTSYYLAQHGHEVTVIDDGSVAPTSVHSAGMIVPSFTAAPPIGVKEILPTYFGRPGPVNIPLSTVIENPRWLMSAAKHNRGETDRRLIEFGKRSLKLFEEFCVKESAPISIKRGVLGLYLDIQQARTAVLELDGNFVGPDEIARLGYRGLGGGVLFDEELAVDPVKLYEKIRETLVGMNVNLMQGVVGGFEVNRRRVNSVIVNNDRQQADMFVIAAGTRTRALCKMLGYEPPILPARGLAAMFETGGHEVVSMSALLEDYGVAVVQHETSRLRVTCFFDLKGFDAKFTESRRRWLLSILEKHLANWNHVKFVSEGVGFRPCTPDQVPVIGRVPTYDNVWINSAHCRLGLTFAPASGLALANMLQGKSVDIPTELFDPVRFSR